jgi:hypothetical protein
MARSDQPLTKEDFKRAAAAQAGRLGLVYDLSKLELDYLTYKNLAGLLDDPELVAERGEDGALRLLLQSARTSNGRGFSPGS